MIAGRWKLSLAALLVAASAWAAPQEKVPVLDLPRSPAVSLPAAAAPELPSIPAAAQIAGPAAAPAAAAAQEPVAPVDAASPRARTVAAALTQDRDALLAPDAPSSLAEVSLEPEAARAYAPSPADWRGEMIYSLMLDRFSRGPNARPQGDPRDGRSRHGGNIPGVIERLDYLKASGVSAILLSPVTQAMSEAAEYHGYGPIHLMAVDPRLGTMADLKRLVSEAHGRGLKIILDMVLNHAGSVFEYEGGSGFERGGRRQIDHWNVDLKPSELKNPENFTRRGLIDDWNDPDQVAHGDFPPYYRHWDTERPRTQTLLIDVAKWWLKETDADGFRLDAIRHMNAGFLKRFNSEIRAYAASLGKSNFLLLGELSTGIYDDLKQGLDLGFDTLYNYPAYRRDNHALHSQGPTMDLESAERLTGSSTGAAAGRLVRFIDLQDVYRFLRAGEPVARLMTALAFTIFSAGIPLIYYGTEQGFRHSVASLDASDGKADPENRQDLFGEGEFKSESSAGDKFDEDSPVFRWVSRLAQIRRDYPALTDGEQWPRWADPSGAGIYAFSRIHEGQEVLVAINTAGEDRSAEMFVDAELTPPGTRLLDLTDPEEIIKARKIDGGSKVRVEVPANGARIFVKASLRGKRRSLTAPSRVELQALADPNRAPELTEAEQTRRVRRIERGVTDRLTEAGIPIVWLKLKQSEGEEHIEVAFNSLEDAAKWESRLPSRMKGLRVRLESIQLNQLREFQETRRARGIEDKAANALRNAGLPVVWLKYRAQTGSSTQSFEPDHVEVAFGSLDDAARWEEKLLSFKIDGLYVRIEDNQRRHLDESRASNPR